MAGKHTREAFRPAGRGGAGRAKLRPKRLEPADAPSAGTAASTSPSPARPERTDTREAAAGTLNPQSAGGAGDTRARKRLAVEEEKDCHDECGEEDQRKVEVSD